MKPTKSQFRRETAAFFSVLLTILILLSSCGEKVEAPVGLPGETAGGAETAATAEETTVITEPPSRVPEGLKFDGREVMLLGGDAVFEHYTMATEETGDNLNDSLYHRYQKVSEQLDVSIGFLLAKASEAVSKIQATVLSGDDTYQLAIVQRATSIAKMVGDHYLHNWLDLPYVDLNGEFWYEDAINSLRVDNFIYYTYGDIYPLSTHVMYYNKDIAEAYNLRSPHEDVLNGSWTIDRLNELASVVPKDLNGDGVMDKNDQYGISFSNTDTINSLMYGCGLTITQRTDDGIRLTPCDEKMVNAYNKILAIFTGDTCYFKQLNELKLTTGQVLFFTGTVHGARTYRDAEVEFGMLPYPKFDDKQEKYVSFLNTELMCVPSVADKELAGAVNQLLAENSADVKTAYYEYLLKEKVARDPESAKVLDIIFDNAINDFIISYCGGMTARTKLYTIPSTLAMAGKSDFVSSHEAVAEAAQKEIDQVIEMILSNKPA